MSKSNCSNKFIIIDPCYLTNSNEWIDDYNHSLDNKTRPDYNQKLATIFGNVTGIILAAYGYTSLVYPAKNRDDRKSITMPIDDSGHLIIFKKSDVEKYLPITNSRFKQMVKEFESNLWLDELPSKIEMKGTK